MAFSPFLWLSIAIWQLLTYPLKAKKRRYGLPCVPLPSSSGELQPLAKVFLTFPDKLFSHTYNVSLSLSSRKNILYNTSSQLKKFVKSNCVLRYIFGRSFETGLKLGLSQILS